MSASARFRHAAGQSITTPEPALLLFVPGKPVPMPRPRVTRFGTYYSKAAQAASKQVIAAWEEASRPRLAETDLSVVLTVVVPRPQAHLLKGGSLSAAGARVNRPTGDLDNYLKLPLDALNGLAWPDDALFVEATVRKAWAPTGHAYRSGLFIEASYVGALRHAIAVETAVQKVTR